VVERLQSEADLDAVASLEARCFTNPWTRDMLARELEQSVVAHVFVLRLPDLAVAGFCSCWIIGDELHVTTIAIDPAHRRRGLGRFLMERVIQEASARGARRATLEVRASNLSARLLYENLGFTVTAIRPRYYASPEEDALILWKDELRDLGSPEL
jgi:ribosomal-protein-alanine N-acetyltransferase